MILIPAEDEDRSGRRGFAGTSIAGRLIPVDIAARTSIRYATPNCQACRRRRKIGSRLIISGAAGKIREALYQFLSVPDDYRLEDVMPRTTLNTPCFPVFL